MSSILDPDTTHLCKTSSFNLPASKYSDVWARTRSKLKVYSNFLSILDDQRLKDSKLIPIGEGHETLNYMSKGMETDFTLPESQEWIPRFMLHPESKYKLAWSMVIAVLLIYTALVMPYSLTFIDSSGLDTWGVIDILLDIIFFIDFIVNCLSAVYDTKGKLIVSRKKILWIYFKSWMLLDLISCVPFGFINSGSNSSSYSSNDYNSALKLLRLPRLYRLFRIARLFKLFKHFKNSEILEQIQEFLCIKQSMMRMVKAFSVILLCLHIDSCFWYYIAKIQGLNPDTWVGNAEIQDRGNWFLYVTSMYWAVTTLCSVGYGDIHAVNNLEKLFSIVWMIFSMYFLSFVIGSLSNMLSGIDSKENQLINKLSIIDEFANEAKLKKKLKNKLKHALRFSTEKTGFSWRDKQNLFNELPQKLKYEVSLAMHQGAIKCIKFFHRKDQAFVCSVVPFLQPMHIQANESVYNKDEYADEIYFVIKGRVSYIYGAEHLCISPIQLGDCFGDIEVALQIMRKYSAKASRDSELLIMNKQVFHRQIIDEIVEEYPKVWEEIRCKAYERNKVNMKTIAEIETLNEYKAAQGFDRFDASEFDLNIERKVRKQQNQLVYTQRMMQMHGNEEVSNELCEKLDFLCKIFSNLDDDLTNTLNHAKQRKIDNIY